MPHTRLRPTDVVSEALRADLDSAPSLISHGPSRTSTIPAITAKPQALFATPEVAFPRWTQACGGFDQPHGTLPPNRKYVFIGAGFANMTTALHVALAGGLAVVLEAANEVGGRACDVRMADGTMAPMGCMRFTASMGLFIQMLTSLGYYLTEPFPNPGEVPTVLSFHGASIAWEGKPAIPDGYETIVRGWRAFLHDGLHKDGHQVLTGWLTIKDWLAECPGRHFDAVRAAEQAWLNAFEGVSLGDAIRMIFSTTLHSKWETPGGVEWSEDDFERFSVMGVGSGGFGPFNVLDFVWLMATFINGFEPDQAVIAQQTGCGESYPGPMAVALSLKARAVSAGVVFRTNARVTRVERRATGRFACHLAGDRGRLRSSTVVEGDRLIVGTTLAAMKHNIAGLEPLVGHRIWHAISSYGAPEGTKCMGLFKVDNIPAAKRPDFPRMLISDNECPQIYSLPASDPANRLILLNYTWCHIARGFNGATAADIKAAARRTVDSVFTNSPDLAAWRQMLDQQVGDLVLQKWGLDPIAHALMPAPMPGQAPLGHTLSNQWASPEAATGVYINGDHFGFGGGRIELPISHAMLVASAIFERDGALEQPAGAPTKLIQADTLNFY